MRRCRSRAAVVAAMAVAFASTAAPAHAYLDPGSGSYLLQLLVGSVLGIGVAIGAFWSRIRGFFGRLFSSNKDG